MTSRHLGRLSDGAQEEQRATAEEAMSKAYGMACARPFIEKGLPGSHKVTVVWIRSHMPHLDPDKPALSCFPLTHQTAHRNY